MWWTIIAIIIAATMGYGAGIKEGEKEALERVEQVLNERSERARATPSAPPMNVL